MNTPTFAKQNSRKWDLLQLIYLVGFEYLEEFLDGLLSLEQNFGEWPSMESTPIPELSLEDFSSNDDNEDDSET